ncbi:hypothetical protein M885DRAFT_577253 [Pelagophyceae sp. CCMP2097]|nr:hypothetical protein M885DRAFT_577253 [Pelagophyceae sp. CCMP2097]
MARAVAPGAGAVRAAVTTYVRRACLLRDASHGLEHAQRVRDTALELLKAIPDVVAAAAAAGLDAHGVIEAAALLHDVCDHKYVDEETEAGRLAIFERDGLLSMLLDASNAGAVKAIIAEVSYSREDKRARNGLEPLWLALDEPVRTLRHVVSDADKIDALGASGLRRCFDFRAAHAGKAPAADAVADATPVDIQEVAQHCDEKLLRLLPLFIRTEAGKRLAQPAHDFMADWRATIQAV